MSRSDRRNRNAGLAVGGVSGGVFAGTNRISNNVNHLYRSEVGRRMDNLEGVRGLDERGRPVGDLRGARRRGPSQTKGAARRASNVEDRASRKRLEGRRNDLAHRYKRGLITPHGRSVIQRATLPLAVGGTMYGLHHSVDKADYSRRDLDTGGAAAGAGMLGYQGGGYSLKPLDRRAERKLKANPGHQQRLAEHRVRSGLPPNAYAGHEAWHRYFRTYPKQLPGAKLKRVLAYSHAGPTGAALTAAVGGVSGVEAARASRRRRHVGKRYEGPDIVVPPDRFVRKRLVDEERRTSIIRGTGFVGGAGALAWGGSRLRYPAAFLRAGAEAVQPLNPRVSNVLRHAEGLRRTTERATDPLGRITGRGVGRMPPTLRAKLEKVPADLRPATATLAGAILVHRSSPVRQTTYRPVVERGNVVT